MTDLAYAEKPEWWTSDHWSTPWDIVRELEKEFGTFDLDPCCRDETAKADRYYTKNAAVILPPMIVALIVWMEFNRLIGRKQK